MYEFLYGRSSMKGEVRWLGVAENEECVGRKRENLNVQGASKDFERRP